MRNGTGGVPLIAGAGSDDISYANEVGRIQIATSTADRHAIGL